MFVVLLQDYGEYKKGDLLSIEAFAELICTEYPELFAVRKIRPAGDIAGFMLK